MLRRFHTRTARLAFALLLALCGASAHTPAQSAGGGGTGDTGAWDKLFEQGQDAHARGQLAEALKLYEEALKLNPEFPEAEYQRGAALVSLKRYDEAERAYRRAIELRADWALPHAALGALLANFGAPPDSSSPDTDSRRREIRHSEAVPLLERALSLDPQNVTALRTLAMVRLFHFKDARAALELLKRLTALPGADANDRRLRARAAQLAGDKADAMEALSQVAPGGSDALTLIERAELRLEAGDRAGALSDAEAVEAILKRAGGDRSAAGAQTRRRAASIFSNFGVELRRADPNKSLEFYRRAAELEPSNVDYATGYASALVQARRFSEAVGVLSRILAVAPDNYAAHANLAAALDELKSYEEAIVEYNWLARARPELAITYYFMGRDHDLLGQYREALAAYEMFLQRADRSANALEIDKVNLRLPTLRDQINRGQGRKPREAKP